MNFIDYGKQVNDIRVDLLRDIDELMINGEEIDASADYLAIADIEHGTLGVQTIFDNFGTKVLKTETGSVVDIADLETDDLVAIYEYLYNETQE